MCIISLFIPICEVVFFIPTLQIKKLRLIAQRDCNLPSIILLLWLFKTICLKPVRIK